MRIAIITTSYPAFLHQLYRDTPDLGRMSYTQQLSIRNDSLFGFADFYSRGFRAHGHEAAEFHFNNSCLQNAWAREHRMAAIAPQSLAEMPSPPSHRGGGMLRPLKTLAKPLLRRLFPPAPPAWQMQILKAQIDAFQPDIIYNQEPAALRGAFLRQFRAPGRKLIGQIASALPPGESFRDYDLMVSSLPNFVSRFRAMGVPAELNRLAFEATVPEKVGIAPKRGISVSFVGNLSLDHPGRLILLERIAKSFPLKMWGAGIEQLAPSSPLHGCYQGEAWGRTMYEVLSRSRVTLNFHAGFAGDHANNLRLYEATGMGALLLTDRKKDLDRMFAPGKEVMDYAGPEDCVAQIGRLLADEPFRERIASAGQQRTLLSHNYYNRTGELAQVFQSVLE